MAAPAAPEWLLWSAATIAEGSEPVGMGQSVSRRASSGRLIEPCNYLESGHRPSASGRATCDQRTL